MNVNVWNPDGNVVKNDVGSVTCHIDLYSGTSLVTGTAFKWYAQDPTATTTAGGDTDGGAGWRLINSTWNLGVTGYTTDTITVPASAVTGQEAYKCVATYGGLKYSGVTTVIDNSDPIMVRLDGVSTFKNGEGTVSIRATLLRDGGEIDSDGTEYTYAWSLYKKDGTKQTFSKSGKTITVAGTDVDGVANLVCDVSK